MRRSLSDSLSTGSALLLAVLVWMPVLPGLWRMVWPGSSLWLSDPGVGVTNSSRTEMLLLALLAFALAGCPASPLRRSSALPWWLAFLAWATLSALLGPDASGGLMVLSGWLAALAVLLTAPSVLPPRLLRPDWRALFWYGPVLLLSLLSLVPLEWTGGEFRAAGPFQLPGALATWLLLLLPLCWDGLRREEGGYSLLALGASSLGLACLVMTVSRAAWLVLIVELTLYLLFLAQIPRPTLRRWLGVGALGLVAVILLRQHLGGLGLLGGLLGLASWPVITLIAQGRLAGVVGRRWLAAAALSLLWLSLFAAEESLGQAAERRLATLASQDQSALGRLEFWRAAVQLSTQNPLLGVGPGRFSEAYPQVQRHYYYYSDSAHGALVELLAEVGWVGAGLFALALGLVVRQARPDPWRAPNQVPLLLGLLAATAYAQVEVSYHFSMILAVGALLLGLLVTPSPAPTPPPSWRLLGLSLVGSLGLLWLDGQQKLYESSLLQRDPDLAYQRSRAVSERLPLWGDPALTALSLGLRSQRPPEELEPLAERAQRVRPLAAVTHQLSGELLLRQERPKEALECYQRALELDPFNRPGTYHGLLAVAQALGDTALSRQTVAQALATYDLTQGWAIAHPGHKVRLQLELRPLLYDIADGLSPWQEPQSTEPLYRFLSETSPQPEARALYGLGMSLWNQGRRSEAATFLRQVGALDASYPLPNLDEGVPSPPGKPSGP